MADTVELVKEKLDIADFLRQYVTLTPAGKNLKALCPFHKERTPSFIISPDRQVWHCFGCNLGGDAISFLMRYENLEFIEALRILAERTGVEMRGSGGDERQHAVLYDINRTAKDFFAGLLAGDTPIAATARDYLQDRGLTVETIHEFELGLAPNGSDILSRHLTKAGYQIADIERAGLVFKTERGTYWDRFRHRIMFPIANHFGKIIGFTGRLMPGAAETEAGKYVNSPETPIFAKSRVLYGFHKSKNHIREAKAAVLVEGQMDFLMAWQAGVKNVAASSGTATTVEHLKHLKRAADTLILAFDADEAGQAATERVADLAAAGDFSVKVTRSSDDAKDPADIVRKDPELFRTFVREAEPAVQFFVRRHLSSFAGTGGIAGGRDAADLKRGMRAVLARVKMIASPVEQAYWIRELAKTVGIAERHLIEELSQVKPPAVSAAGAGVHTSAEVERRLPESRRDLISQRLLGILVRDPALREAVEANLSFFQEPYQRLFGCFSRGEKIPTDLSALADLITLRSSLELTEEKGTQLELAALVRELKREHYRQEQERLGTLIRAAETSGDIKSLEGALQDFDRISKEIYNI